MSHWHAHRYGYLFSSLILLFVFFPLAEKMAGHILLDVVFVWVVFTSFWAVNENRRGVVASITILVLVVVGAADLHQFGAIDWGIGQQLSFFSDVLLLAFLTIATVAVLWDVLSSRDVNADKVWGAISVYVLMGVSWGILYSLIGRYYPESFNLPTDLAEKMKSPGADTMIYYSFVTLSTLGYGDITPAVKTTRVLSALEALTGQIYLAVLVARLVAIHMTGSKPDNAG